jgi:hypothetical protein
MASTSAADVRSAADSARYRRLVPNWCQNRLTVTGDPERIASFREAVRTIDADGNVLPLSLEKVAPTPTGYLDGTERWRDATDFHQMVEALDELTTEAERRRFMRDNPGFASTLMEVDQVGKDDWYHWRDQFWGTKWDLSSESTEVMESGDDTFCLVASSAWSPIVPATSKLAAGNPELGFELVFAEPDGGFAGRAVWRGGALVSLDEHSYGALEPRDGYSASRQIVELLEKHWPLAADWFRDHDDEEADALDTRQ